MDTLNEKLADVWSEYRQFFAHYYGITDERVAHSVVLLVSKRMARPDVDRVAEALKEFAIRAQERGVAESQVAGRLEAGRDLTHAGQLWGTAAEDLGLDALDLLVRLVRPRTTEV